MFNSLIQFDPGEEYLNITHFVMYSVNSNCEYSLDKYVSEILLNFLLTFRLSTKNLWGQICEGQLRFHILTFSTYSGPLYSGIHLQCKN
jgi:hypothetical protein